MVYNTDATINFLFEAYIKKREKIINSMGFLVVFVDKKYKSPQSKDKGSKNWLLRGIK
jgi:hypothetical protein